MLSACNIVNNLLETDELSSELLRHYVDQAGDWVLLVPATVPSDPKAWFVKTLPVTSADRAISSDTELTGRRWKKESTHRNREEAVSAAHAFLKAHGKTP